MYVARRLRHATLRFLLAASAVALLPSPNSRARNDPRPAYRHAEVVEAPTDQRPMGRVGQIFIIGNEWTYQGVILQMLELYPGAPFSPADLRAAERRLARSKLFKSDVEKGTGPTVRVQPTGGDEKSEFWDVWVRVEEEPFTPWVIDIGDTGLFAALWYTGGIPAVVFQTRGFPIDMIRFLFTGEYGDLPLVIQRLIP